MKNFRGVNPEHASKLAVMDVEYAGQMLKLGRTQIDRQKLSERTGIPIRAILEFVKLSDLSRIEGAKDIRARLYYDAGIDTAEKMAKMESRRLSNILGRICEKDWIQRHCSATKGSKIHR